MSNLRTSRIRLAAAAATTVLAALSLTACNDGTGARSEGPATQTEPTSTPKTSPSASTSNSPDPEATSNPSNPSGSSNGSSGAQSATGAKKTTDPAASGTPVTCEGSNTRTVAAPLNRPVNHMLLTVTNTGSRSCYLYGYPAVRFTDAQSVPPAIEDSKPQAVVTLKPGESGYASVNLSSADGSGTNGRTVKTLTVYFSGRSLSGSVGKAATPPLPAQGVYIDDSLKVTYWQQSMNDATDW
ncbi:DUF4232 domain-containing protein [Streptomyces sp. 7R007]